MNKEQVEQAVAGGLERHRKERAKSPFTNANHWVWAVVVGVILVGVAVFILGGGAQGWGLR